MALTTANGTITLDTSTGNNQIQLTSGSGEIDLTTTGLFDLNSGNLDIDSATTTIDTAANTGFSIDGNYASNVSVTGGNLTLSTITSGDLLLTSAAATTLTSTSGTLTLNATGQTVDINSAALDIDSSGNITLDTSGTATMALTTANGNITLDTSTGNNQIQLTSGSGQIDLTTTGTLDLNSATTTIDATAGISFDAGAASNFTTSAGLLTLSGASGVTVTSTGGTFTLDGTGQTVDLNSAALDIDSSGNITLDTSGTATLALTTANGNITLDTSTGNNTIALNTGTGDVDLTASTFDIDAGTIDLSTQTVDVTLNNAVDAINFDSDTLSIDALNNRVGIGTTSPTATLHIASGGIRFPDNSLMTAAGVGSSSSIGSTTDAILNADNDGNGSGEILFQINGANLMVMTNAGLFGIGDTSPDFLLDIASSSAASTTLSIDNTSTGDAQLLLRNNGVDEWFIGYDDSQQDVFRITDTAFSATNATGLTIEAGGNVGIGTTNPSTALDVSGALTLSTALSVGNGGTGGTTFTSGDLLVGAGAGAFTTTSTLAVNKGGSGAATFTVGGVLFGAGTAPFTDSGLLGNGQLLIGDGTGNPAVAGLTGTANEITVTSGAGTITLDIPDSPLFTTPTLDTPVATSTLSIRHTSAGDPILQLQDTDSGTNIWFLGFDNSDANKFRLTPGLGAASGNFSATSSGITVNLAGFVGIGTTNPTVALDISGALTVTGAIVSATLDTGQGANELYDMDQNVLTTSSPSFTDLTLSGGDITGINSTALDLGEAASGEITVTGDLMANSTSDSVGTSATRWENGFFTNLDVTNFTTASSSSSGTTASTFSINSDNITNDGEDSTLEYERGSATPNAVIQWDSGNDTFDFNFGIRIEATTTPQLTIGLGGAEDTALLYDGNAQDFYIALQDSSDDLLIGTGSTIGTNVRMVIENGGNVGIGTATPDDLLDIFKLNDGASASDVFLTITQASTTAAADPYIDFEIGEDTSIWRIGVDDSDGNKFRISEGAAFNATSSGLTINAAGFVGIGTTNPTTALDVSGALTLSTALAVGSGGTGVSSFGGTDAILYTTSTDTLSSTTTLSVSLGGTGGATFSTGDLLLGAGTGIFTTTSTLAVNKGGTGAATFTDGGILLGSGTGPFTVTGQPGSGQLLIGSAGADPVLANLTGTANEITVTDGAGSITLDIPDSPVFITPTFSSPIATSTLSIRHTSSGDPILQLQDNTTNEWFLGFDNSDANKFRLTPALGAASGNFNATSFVDC